MTAHSPREVVIVSVRSASEYTMRAIAVLSAAIGIVNGIQVLRPSVR